MCLTTCSLGVGCNEAIFALRTTVCHFTAACSSVYLHVAALDIRKAFDSVHHDKMFDSLISTGVPNVTVNILRHWYSILRVNVR